MRHAFLTPAWLLMVEHELQRILDEGRPDSTTLAFRLTETYRHAPAERAPADRTLALSIEVRDGIASLRPHAEARFDLMLEMIWDDACRSVKMASDVDHDAFCAWRLRTGRMKITGQAGDALGVLRQLHRVVAERTA